MRLSGNVAGRNSRRGCLVETFKTPNGVADGTLSFEAAFCDPDHRDEIDTMADLNEAQKTFDGKDPLTPVAEND